jgi:hypothetical protein
MPSYITALLLQVFSRDLDVLEAIERGLKVIQEKIRQQGMCNVRPLCLQLNQIETVMGILDNEQLELGMPLEVCVLSQLHTMLVGQFF